MNDDLFDLLPDGTVIEGHGGKRAGAGRRKGYSPKARKQIEAGEIDPNDSAVSDATKLAIRKAVALTEKEEALAQQAWLKFNIDSGEYLPRAAFREASATLLSELAQGLRSLPDEIERKFSLAPEVLQLLEAVIDERLNAVALGLEVFTGADE